ncbi:ribonuclease H-like domain-containing protein [Tanacetum coccineum]
MQEPCGHWVTNSVLMVDPVSRSVFTCMTLVIQFFGFCKSILRYVRGTIDHGLQLHVSSTSQLTAYTDVDWAGCHVTRRSTSGYCVFLGDNLLSLVVAETAWIRNLLLELHTPLSTATLVYCDNVSVVYLSTNPVQHQRTKHIEIDIHFVREYVASGQVRVLHVPSRFQYDDIICTKGLPTTLFLEFRSSPRIDRGECNSGKRKQITKHAAHATNRLATPGYSASGTRRERVVAGV